MRRGQDGWRDGAGVPDRRPRGLWLTLIGGLAIWLLALGGVARAGPLAGYEIQTTRATVTADGAAVDVTATCTAGKVVVGGGFHIGTDLKVYSSEPADGLGGPSDHSWNVLVRNDGSFDEQITVTAVCVSGPPAGYRQTAKTVNVGADTGIHSVAAACPGGQEVVGGGFHISTPDLVKVSASEPSATATISSVQWEAIVRNDDPTVAQPVTATAICVDTAALSGYAEPLNQVSVAPSTSADVVATCPEGDKVLSGGFDIETPDDVTVLSSEPTGSTGALSDHEWSSQVSNHSATNARQTTVTAICAAAPTLAPTVTGVSPSTGTVNGGTTVTITGSDFTGATAVNFGDGLAPSFTVDSSTRITATSPPGGGPVDVVVTTPGGTSVPNPPADQFTYLPEPTITTKIDQTGPLALGATFTDTASVSFDGTRPTGTVTFDVFGRNSGSECTGPPMFTDIQTLTSGTATSSPFTGIDAGTYQVVAHYSGDSIYAPTTSNCFDPAETISVSQAIPQVTTQVSQDPITLGDAFTDTATLAPVPAGATPPTGTVTFDVYGPNDNTGCDTTPALSSTTSVDASGTAVSDPLIPTSPGLYTIVASYSGDRNYAPASTGCGAETVDVRMAGPTITTQVSATSIDPGGSFDDTATVTAPGGDTSPTGTVTFSVYGPDDPTCTSEPVLDPMTNLDGSTVNSGSLTPPSPGIYRVVASYSGDNTFAPSSTACGDPNETVTVGRSTAVITSAVSASPIALGQAFHDTATLAPPAGAPSPTGAVTFTFFATAACTGTPAFTSTNPLDEAGTAAVSNDFTPPTAGTYHVIATYPGDAHYNAVATACGDPGENVVVSMAATSIATRVSPATIGLGSSFHDTATLTPTAGATAPTGAVMFSVYGPTDAACAGTPAFTSTNQVNGSGTSAVSSDFTPAAAGTYRVIATYAGDANYAGSASSCADPAEAVVVNRAASTLTTQVSAATIVVGSSFSDQATLAPPAGAPSPTGAVTFTFFATPACTGTPAFTSTVGLDPTGTTASSDPFTPGAPGGYRVIAAYSGDGNYVPVATACGDPGEAVVVGQATAAITSAATPAAVSVGGVFSDTARLAPPAGAPHPTGTVTFTVYAPGDTTCAGPAAFTSINPLDGSGTAAISTAFTPTTSGTYRVVARYAGDADYAPAATACGDPSEVVQVSRVAPTLTTAVSGSPITLGGSFHDTATIAGVPPGAPPPSGTVTFNVFGPADPACAATPVFTSTVGVDPAGTTATSADFTPSVAGTYRLIATYAGDASYAAAATACADPAETVVVGRAPLPIATAVAPSSIVLGATFQDAATLGPGPAGAAVPTGTVTFTVYRPGDPTCSAAPVLTSTNPVNAAGTAAISGTFRPTGAGTYRVVATYGGDANYSGSASSCADPTEAVTVTRAPLAMSTQVAPATITVGASFHDTATLGSTPAGVPAPTGTVTFAVYGPGDPSCSGEAAFTASTDAGATVSSTDFTPASAGTYQVVATYGGDANYAPAASTCADPAEAVVVNLPPPTVTGLAPRSGPEAGGTPVTITGTNLAGATAVDFGTAAATGLSVNPAGTQITATAPPGTGTVGVTVVTPSGTAAAGRYTYLSSSPPVVTGVAPASGPLGGGTGVVVFGSGLSGATAVNFGGLTAAVVAVNADGTQLTTVVPPGSGTVDVTVTTPLGGTSATNAADRYTYVAAPPPPPAPTVTSLTPASGPTAGGTTVTIAGADLLGATAVRFGTTPAAAFTVNGPTRITATAPAGAGTVDVTVTTPGGTSATGAADQYAFVASPGPGGSGSGSGSGGASTGGGPPTGPAPPKSETGPPKVISSSSAEFTATINPEGLPTTMHFEYAAVGGGATIAAVTYDARTPEQTVGSDFADHTVTATVANLLPNSTYHVRAVAANPSGVTPSPDTTFQTATDPPPPPPVLGKSVNATPISGTVLVLLPGQGHISSAGAYASAVKGVGFIPLTEARQLPVGTIFDTSGGVARLTSATAVKGATQSGDFSAGVFKLLQDRRQKGLTELDLVEGRSTTAKCAAPVGKAQTAAKRALPKTVLNLLRATAKGKFKTRGKYSSATVRGTTWTTTDRCDGTLTAVKRGVVVVSDLRRKRQIVLRAGRAYLAKAP